MSMRVAITAAAVRTALGDSADGVWRAIEAGRSAVGPIRGFDASGFGDVDAAQIWMEPEIPEDDPTLRILGPHGRLLDAVAMEAHEAAGLQSVPREEVGLFVAMGMVDSPVEDLRAAALASRNGGDAMDLGSFFAGNYRQIHPLWPLSMLNNVAVGQIAIDLDIRGDNVVLASGACAGVRAVLEAAHAVAEGSCRAAIAAGVSTCIGPAALARARLGGESAPLGEGGAALVLEAEATARARGVPVLGLVEGGGSLFLTGNETADREPGKLMRLLQGMGAMEVETVLDGWPAALGALGPGHGPTTTAVALAAWRNDPHAGRRRRVAIRAGDPDGGVAGLALGEAR